MARQISKIQELPPYVICPPPFLRRLLTQSCAQTQIRIDSSGSYYEVDTTDSGKASAPSSRKLETAQISLNDCLACRCVSILYISAGLVTGQTDLMLVLAGASPLRNLSDGSYQDCLEVNKHCCIKSGVHRQCSDQHSLFCRESNFVGGLPQSYHLLLAFCVLL